jgi:MFS family permease
LVDRLLSRHLGLLRAAPGFRLLFLATLASGVGTWLAVVALTIDVFDRTGSGTWVSALLIADFLPAIVIGLLLGPLLDRLSRRRLMVVSDLVRAGVFCALPFTSSPGGIVALAGVAGFATAFFRPAVYAGLPNLVEEAQLAHANSLLQTVENVANTAGPLLGGVVVAASGPHLAYWINAVTFVVSALLVARIPARLLQAEAALSRGHWRDLAEGFELVRRSRALLTVLVAWSLVILGNAGVNVAEVFLAKVSFDAGDFGYGLLFAGFGVGLVIGSLAGGTLVGRRPLAQVYGGSILVMALGVGAAAVSPNVWVAAACVVVSGCGNGAAVVCNALLVQRGAPDHLRGRAFTLVMSVNFAVLGIGMIAAGRLTDAYGARWVWGAAAVLAAGAGALGYVLARGVEEEPEPAAAEPAPPADPAPAQ